MNTDKLIATLAADRTMEPAPPRMLAAAALGGSAITALLFFALIHPRPDFMIAMHTWRFIAKFVLALTLAVSASALVLRAGRPDSARGRVDTVLLAAPLLLAAAIAVEVLAMPAASWGPRLVGHNAMVCLVYIPLLSLAPLAALLFALRHAAVTEPVRAGALAGLMAGGLGALFYAAHCFDDSPLFVAVWYTLGITFVTAAGAWLGRHVLAW
ncbi:MAG: NrsF family protein [Rhizomicrobium sp.]